MPVLFKKLYFKKVLGNSLTEQLTLSEETSKQRFSTRFTLNTLLTAIKCKSKLKMFKID